MARYPTPAAYGGKSIRSGNVQITASNTEVNANLAQVSYDKCIQCGKCAEKCPVKVITPPPAS